MNSQNPIFATFAYVGSDSLDGADTSTGVDEVYTGLLWANERLFLVGEQINFLAELVRQKKQLCNGVGVHISGPLMARYLLHVGVDHVDAGVHGVVQFP